MPSKNFTNFDLKPSISDTDYIVGYKTDGTAEYRTTFGDLVNYLKPYLEELPPLSPIFNYTTFSSITNLSLVGVAAQVSNYIRLTPATGSSVGNVYYSSALQFNKNFSLQWSLSVDRLNGADGFTLQWTNSNTAVGGVGGDKARVMQTTTLHAISFDQFTYNTVTWWYKNSSPVTTSLSAQPAAASLRQQVFYWADYNHGNQTMKFYYNTTNSKPLTAANTFNQFVFDNNSYYIGIGASTGGTVQIHDFKSWSLSMLI